jgi:putative acetyltransferase
LPGAPVKDVTSLTVEADDPRRPDIRALLERHVHFAHASSPREHVHALDVDGLLQLGITFYSARDADGRLLGIGALKELDAGHGEIKSMHTAEHSRRAGVGGAMLRHIMGVARERGYARLSLETRTGPAFEPAHSLYERAGFAECEPFGEYTRNPHSVCMTIALG